MKPGEGSLAYSNAYLIQVLQQIERILIDAVSSGTFEFVLAATA